MSGTPDLLSLFNEPSVRLLYFMAMIALSCAALLMALGQRMRSPRERGAGRYATAAFGIVWALAMLMIGALAVIMTSNPAILPPIDRAVMAMVILLVGWAFLTADELTKPLEVQPNLTSRPKSSRRRSQNMRPKLMNANSGVSAMAFVLGLVILGGFVYTATQWYNLATPTAFNVSSYNLAWTAGTLALCIVFIVLLVTRVHSVVDTPLKVLFFALLTIGYGYTLYIYSNGTLTGDEPGAVRLALTAALPLWVVVIYRFVISRLTVTASEKAQLAADAAQKSALANLANENTAERDAIAVQKAFGLMLERDNPEDLPYQIVQGIAQSLKADVVAILVLDDVEYADVIAAYDHVQRHRIPAMAVKVDEQPALKLAIEQRQQQMLTTEKNLNELVDLYTRLDIQKVGPTYWQPLTTDGNPVGVIVVALPYTQRILRGNETRLLEAIAPVAARLMLISRAAQRMRLTREQQSVQAIVDGSTNTNLDMPEVVTGTARAEVQASLELARLQINELTSRVRDLQIELDYERSRMTELGASESDGMSITQRMERMAAERAQLEAERERLMMALQQAQTQLAVSSGEDSQMVETMLQVLQQERDQLQAEKDKLESELSDIRTRGTTEPPAVLRDMLNRLSEERARYAVERDTVRQKLTDIEAQMTALGIEGGTTGLATTVVQLTTDRSYYKALAERMTNERDTLLAERQKLDTQIANEAARDTRITQLETELRRLAEDREAIARQRDALRNERESYNADRSKWEELRTRMVAEMAGLQEDAEAAIFERNRAVTALTKLNEERMRWLQERDRLTAESMALQSERDGLLARLEGNREQLKQMGADGVGALKRMIEDLTEERSELEHRLLKADAHIKSLEEKSNQLGNKLKRATQPMEVFKTDGNTAEVMVSLAQELRTPMNSIGAYIDLLLGESVGILGALQRQFLTRVKANADRLGSLVEDFVRVTAIDTGQINLKPNPVDLDDVINDAITATNAQFRERNIALKLDIQDDLPTINGDRDALQQIVIQLLSNAYLASPIDGEVMLSAQVERNFTLPASTTGAVDNTTAPNDVVLMAVRDLGGGIPSEEQTRVFSRLYRADNPLIQGLGDTGVGLSIARALTEAHGGRIWLDSTQSKASTFKVALPINGIPEKANSYAS